MAVTPETPETETSGKLGRLGSYALLGGTAVASWFVLPVVAAVVTAAPLLSAVVGIGAAATVAAKKEWREPTLGFFKKIGGMFGDALKQVISDYRGARDWAKEKAEEQKFAAPANDDTAPSTLGAKASAADFNASADPAVKVTVKPAPKPAPLPTQRLG